MKAGTRLTRAQNRPYTSCMTPHGFLRVAAASPELRVADCPFNADRTLALMAQAEAEGVEPRSSSPSWGSPATPAPTCSTSRRSSAAAEAALASVVDASARRSSAASPSSACRWSWTISSSTAPPCCTAGSVLGVVPKSFLPNYKEFYEARWFAPAANARRSRRSSSAASACRSAPTCCSTAGDVPGFVVGVEICEDLWVPVPPSSLQALAGATVLLNLSASNEVDRQGRLPPAARRRPVGPLHRRLRLRLVRRRRIDHRPGLRRPLPDRRERHAARRVAALPARRARCSSPTSTSTASRIDRMRTNSFDDASRCTRPRPRRSAASPFDLDGAAPTPRPAAARSTRTRSCRSEPDQLRERCDEIFHTQVAGLAKRLEHIGTAAGRHRRLRRPRFDAGAARRVQDAATCSACRASASRR